MSATAYTTPSLSKPWWDVASLNPQGTLSANGANQYVQAPAGGWSNMTVDTGGPSPNTAFNALLGATSGAPKQDTGWSSTPASSLPNGGMSVDYARTGQTGAPSSASPYGYSYSSPGAGFNPWGLYDGRNGYDGTASDGVGLYNGTLDTKKAWGPNGQGEYDRDRVWRMTLDDLKAQGLDPGSADPAKVQAVFLSNVGRLHRDYDNTAGLGAQAWANSAFAGYDKVGQGGAPSASQYAPNTLGGNVDYASGGASGQGGNVSIYPGGASPYDAPNTPNSAGSATPGGAASAPSLPATGGGGTGNATPMGGFYQSDPSLAVNQFLQQHSIGVTNHSPFADFLRKVANAVVPSMISVMPPGANGQSPGDRLNNLPQMITDMLYGNGGQMFGNLGNFAGQALGAMQGKLGGMAAPDVEALLKTINGMKSLGMNPYMQSFNQTALNDLIQQYGLVGGQQAAAGQTPATPDWLTQNDTYGLFR